MATSKDKLLQAFLRQQGKPRKRRSPVSPPPGGVRTRRAPTYTPVDRGYKGDLMVSSDPLYQKQPKSVRALQSPSFDPRQDASAARGKLRPRKRKTRSY